MRLSFFILLFILLSFPVCAQWNTIFSDDFNRPDGPLGTPWMLMGDTLYIQSNRIVANTQEYGLMQYIASQYYETTALEAAFNFNNDNDDGRYQFFIGGGDTSTTMGFIAKISDDEISLYQINPELELVNAAYTFSLSSTYKMRLESDYTLGLGRLIIMDDQGTVLTSIQAASSPGAILWCACGIENENAHNKWIDDLSFEYDGSVSVEDRIPHSPVTSVFYPSYPNPFNQDARLTFTLSHSAEVSLAVYDLKARLLDNLFEGIKPAGTHALNFNAAGLPSGIYFVRLTAGNYQQTQKIQLIK